MDEKNELHNRYMHISGKFIENEKQDIENQKQDIENQKQDISADSTLNSKLLRIDFSNKTVRNIRKLYTEFGYKVIFGRADVMHVLNITPSPASELIKKMLQAGIITAVNGKGKGKYLFKE